jgi:hypothetical protein
VYDLAALKPVGRDSSGKDLVYSNDWNAQLRQISLAGGFLTSDIALDSARDRLYSIDSTNQSIVVVDGASNAGFNPPYTTVGGVKGAVSVAVDSVHDRLYVGGSNSNAYIFNRASTLGTSSEVPATNVFAIGVGAPSSNPVWAIALP